MRKHPEGWEVGMEVFVTPKFGMNYTAQITKIGRRWIGIESNRGAEKFDATTLRMKDGGYSALGRVYASAWEYERSQESNQQWQVLRGLLSSARPAHLTAEQIAEMIATIKGDAT